MSMTETMPVLEWTAPRQMELKEAPIPQLADGQVLVRVDSVGICGSEIEAYLGLSPTRKPPLVLGHELCGDVVDSRACRRKWPAGTPVTVYPLLPCFTCNLCRAGNTHVCPSRKILSMHLPGAYSGYIAVDERIALEIPPKLFGPLGALAEPLGCAAHAVKMGCLYEDAMRDSLLVVGAGPIGLLAVAYAAFSGIQRIVAVDLVDARLEHARRLGATAVISSNGLGATAVSEAIEDTLGSRPETVIEAVGVEATRSIATASVAPLGTVVFVGLHTPATTLNVNHIVRNQIACLGCYGTRFEDFHDAITALEAGVLKDESWIRTLPLGDGDRAYEELIEKPEKNIKTILRPQTE